MTTSELWLEPMIFSLPIPNGTYLQNLRLLSAVSQILGFLPLSHLTMGKVRIMPKNLPIMLFGIAMIFALFYAKICQHKFIINGYCTVRFYVALDFSSQNEYCKNAILKHLKVSTFLAAPTQLDNVVSLPFHHSLISGGFCHAKSGPGPLLAAKTGPPRPLLAAKSSPPRPFLAAKSGPLRHILDAPLPNNSASVTSLRF